MVRDVFISKLTLGRTSEKRKYPSGPKRFRRRERQDPEAGNSCREAAHPQQRARSGEEATDSIIVHVRPVQAGPASSYAKKTV